MFSSFDYLLCVFWFFFMNTVFSKNPQTTEDAKNTKLEVARDYCIYIYVSFIKTIFDWKRRAIGTLLVQYFWILVDSHSTGIMQCPA